MRRSRVLAVLASATLFVAVIVGYADRAIFNADQFADRATDALRDDRLRNVVADEVTDDLVLSADSDLLAARPVIESVVAAIVGSDAFTGLFHAAARDLHRAVFERDQDTATLTIADAATLVRAALRALSPGLANQIDSDTRVQLLDNDIGPVTGDLARLAEGVRLLTVIAFLVALALAAGAVWGSPDRRRTATDLGIGMAAVGVAVVLVYAGGRSAVLGSFDDPSGRDAAAAVWDSFLADLARAGWVLALAGAVVAAAAASLIRPVEIDEPLRRLGRALMREPEAGWARALRGLGLVALGVVVLVEREAVVHLALTLIGAYLVYAGVVVLLRLIYRPPVEAPEPARAPRGRRLAVAAIAALLVAGSVTAFAATGGTSAPEPEQVATCNGSLELCDRALSKVVLPATHNSMSAPLPGWFSSEHQQPIPNQLEAGVRGLLVDSHYGDKLADGRVRTDFTSREDLEKAVEQDAVSDDAVAAANRIRDRIGFSGKGKRGMYLCHTFCELGATPLGTALGWINEFMVAHPGEVLVVVNQDYVEPAEFVAAVGEAGLADLAYAGPITATTPTLREMIDSGRRIVFLAENDAGAASWYRPAYKALVEETPYTFKSAAALTDPSGLDRTCRPNRGPAEGAPLFLMNHWVSTDPFPKPSDAKKVNARKPLLARVRACARVRGRLPGLVAVNFSELGDVFGVVDALNDDPRRYTPD